MSRVNERFQHAIRFAQDEIKRTGSVHPMFVAFRGDEAHIFTVNFETEMEKRMMLDLMRIIFTTGGYEHYIFMNEVWMVKTEEMIDGRVSDHPDRVDGLMVISVTPTDRRGEMMEVVKNDDGSVSLVSHDTYEGPNFTGAFTELLQPISGIEDLPVEWMTAAQRFQRKVQKVTFH